MKRLGVFCASATKLLEDHVETAEELARQCAMRGVAIVHGGSNTGLMSVLTKAVRAHGGRVEAVMCESLVEGRFEETSFDRMAVTASYMERISSILGHVDDVAVLPGGPGTLHEALTAIVLKHVGEFAGRVAIANPRGYWGCLITLLGLDRAENPRLYVSDSGPISSKGLHILGGCDPIRLGAELFSLATGLPSAPLPWDMPDAEAGGEAKGIGAPATG